MNELTNRMRKLQDLQWKMSELQNYAKNMMI